MRFFNPDTPIMQWLQKIANVIFCGFFWLLCCLPIITIGASTTAMYRMMFNIREEKSARPGDFFRVFGREFGKSTLIWLIELLTAGILVFGYFVLTRAELEEPLLLILLALFIILFLIWFITFQFAYALTSYFENTIGNTLKNALFIPIANRKQAIPVIALTVLPVTFCILALQIGWIFFYYVVLYILPLWIFIVFPVIFYRQTYHMLLMFEKYIPETDETLNSIEE